MDKSSATQPDPRLNMVGIRTGYALGGIAWLVCFVAAWLLADS
jgi:hypothetical protein